MERKTMSIKKDLKREGIEVINKFDTLSVNTLAKKIADIISSTFPSLKLNSNELFIKLSRLNMYYAKLPSGISAKYFYKNKSIYFSDSLEKQKLSDVAIHECIHYLQEKCEKNGNIVRLGLCDYTLGNLPGTGINEAAVQLMAVKCTNNNYENVKYFDIELETNTPTYYPLECALVSQMAYEIGEDVLYSSTINSDNKFKERFISITSAKTYYKIQENIDLLVEEQSYLEMLYSNFQNTDERLAQKETKEISKQKDKIRNLFLETQKIILTSYFDSAINLAYSPKLIENYRNKLYLYKNLIGHADGDNFYNEYYIDKMMELEKRYTPNVTEVRELAVVKNGFFAKLIRKVKVLLGFNLDYAEMKDIEK